MSSRRILSCPGCRRPFRRVDIQEYSFQCPYCSVPIRISRRLILIASLPAFLVSLLISQLLGLKVYAAPLWIPIWLLCDLFIGPRPVPWLAPLRLDTSSLNKGGNVVDRNLVLFFTVWFASIAGALFYTFVFGWATFLLGGSRTDIFETLDMWSAPLGLINSAFVIRPNKNFVEAIGIISANCYYYALVITLVLKFVHQRLRRNLVTELGISGRTLANDDEI